MTDDISDLRREYDYAGLDRDDLADDPFEQFARWFDQARDAGIRDSSAMIVATVDGDGQPSQRTVLLKGFDTTGFVFYTSTESRKAHELAANQRISLLFPWLELGRQVIVRGRASTVSAGQAADYFRSRPRASQIATSISPQSQPVASRVALVERFAALERRLGTDAVPVPSFWGGYRVVPEMIEFWQGRQSRLHDRFVYSADGRGGWRIERLGP